MRRRLLISILAAGALALVGCGAHSGSGAAGGAKPELVVSAAASLKSAFTHYGTRFSGAGLRFSFAGSDMLAAQISQGARPDVFASANLVLPNMLYARGLVEKPVVFAANRLVLAVPARSEKVRSLSDVQRPGITVAIGSATVPIGAYTRIVLGRLGSAQSAKVLSNVRTEEPDVNGIIGKLTEGAVDVGFTYATDVAAAKGALRAIELPASLQPVVAYGASIVAGSRHGVQARRFIDGLLSGPGQAALRQAGFLAAPAG